MSLRMLQSLLVCGGLSKPGLASGLPKSAQDGSSGHLGEHWARGSGRDETEGEPAALCFPHSCNTQSAPEGQPLDWLRFHLILSFPILKPFESCPGSGEFIPNISAWTSKPSVGPASTILHISFFYMPHLPPSLLVNHHCSSICPDYAQHSPTIQLCTVFSFASVVDCKDESN